MRIASTIVAAWLLVSCATTASQQTASSPALRPAPPEVEALVRAAIADRYQASDIPDQALLQGKDAVHVFDEMKRSGYVLSAAAVPKIPSTNLVLVGRARARDLARGTGSGLHFIEVDDVRIEGDRASLKMGVGVYPDPAFEGAQLCCCSARAELARDGAAWQFRDWGERVCF
jgi:hypothetical protein